MSIDPRDVTEWATASKAALDGLRALFNILPKGEDRDRAEAGLKHATESLARADAQLAQKLGYRLCHCTFPPSIMLTKPAEKVVYCPACSHSVSTAPRPEEESSWIAARNPTYY